VSDLTELVMRLVDERTKLIVENREKLLEAFVAEVGCLPSDAVLVEKTIHKTDPGGIPVIETRVWIERCDFRSGLHK
jgi:hypothetical protein